MFVSVQFWVFCALLGVVLDFLLNPIVPYVSIRLAIYYVISMFCKRQFFFKHVSKEHKAEGQTILVTGASTGIGKELTRQLATERGARVICAARSLAKLQANVSKYGNSSGDAVQLDLADVSSIKAFARTIKHNYDRLDCLVLNAAYEGTYRTTRDGFEQNFGVNHLGHMLLVHDLLDLLLASGSHARIIVVASDLHRLTSGVRFDDLQFNEQNSYTWMGFTAYNHSKLCNVLFANKLADMLRDTPITVHSCHPGTPVQSELVDGNPFIGNPLMKHLICPILFHLFCRQAADGAQTLLHCVVSEQCAQKTGLYFDPSPAAQDLSARDRLWSESCKMLQLDADWMKREPRRNESFG